MRAPSRWWAGAVACRAVAGAPTATEAARRFTGVTARLRSVHLLPVIEPDEVETGAVAVKRTGPEKVRYLLRFIEPDPKAILFHDETVEVFYPKRIEIEVWN